MHFNRTEGWHGPRGFIKERLGWGGGGEHAGFRGGSHWRGGGRPFDHGDLKLVVLAMLAEKPRHGYEIIKEIEDRFGGTYTPSPGVVYPTLTMLEELGHATVEEKGGKKLYTITGQGTAYLASNQAQADRAMGRMQEMGDMHGHGGGGRSPQLMRAIHNFKMALKLRMRSGPMSDDQLKTIVAAIDAAAVAIERS